MGRKTILTCAVTGNITTRDQHPGLPVTPAEIAQAAVEAHAAGAAVAHIHARDPQTGRGTINTELFREIVDRIRDAGSDVIINLSTGEGGRFVPGDDEPSVAAPGTTLTRPETRVEHVRALSPEIATLDLNTMFSGRAVVINTPRNVQRMGEIIYAAGSMPEVELFDSGDLHLARYLIDKGVLKPPMSFQIVLGVRFGAPADPATLHYLASQLPRGFEWGAFGIGRQAFPMLAQSWLLGGHVRTGLEDTVHIREGVLARDNAELVEAAGGLVERLGGSLATAAEAREILGLAPL